MKVFSCADVALGAASVGAGTVAGGRADLLVTVRLTALGRDLSRAIEFDQSQMFKKIYENEFGTPGGEPYGALIGDYEWTNHPEDLETLRLMSNISAGAFAPFISAAGAGMFGFDSWTELSKPRDLAKIFDTVEFQKWRSFRDSEDSRFVNLVMPRVISRLPYGAATKPIDEFAYEEIDTEIYGSTAVVLSRYRQQARIGDRDASGDLRITDVWTRRDGRWQIVRRHATPER